MLSFFCFFLEPTSNLSRVCWFIYHVRPVKKCRCMLQFNLSRYLSICLSDFHTYLKKWGQTFVELLPLHFIYTYINTWYFQYMKKYPWNMLYFKRFRGQTLEYVWGHDKLKIYRIKIKTHGFNFANIYSYGQQEWYSI